MRLLRTLLTILILTVVPHSQSQSAGNPQIQPKHNFAFVIDCDSAGRESNICLLGKYKSGIQVTLLEVGQSRTCLSKTKEAIDHKDHLGDTLYSVTMVSTAKECGDASLYGIAVLGSRITSYQIVKLDEVTEKKKVRSLDKFVRNKNVLEKLRNTETGRAAEDYELSEDLPIVHRYPIPKMETLIVSYKTRLGEGGPEVAGPRTIIINNIAYPLTGWCSYPYMRTFRLNGEYYLESGSCCCECGIRIQELFKIKQTGPVEVHSDGSLSN